MKWIVIYVIVSFFFFFSLTRKEPYSPYVLAKFNHEKDQNNLKT